MLSSKQVTQFKESGYTTAPDFFTSEEVRAMQLELKRLEAAGLGRDVMPGSVQQNIHFTPLETMSTLFRALPFKEDVIATVAQLIGHPVLLWLDQIFLKPAHVGAGNSWHEDNARFKAPDVTRGTGMWIAFHDATRANGTLELIPGSFEDSTLTSAFRQPAAEEEVEAVVVELLAGSVAFFNFGMLHCTRDNRSDAPRAAAAYHFLQGDNLPAAEFLPFGKQIPLSGGDCSGGLNDYGVIVAGTWQQELMNVLG